MPYLLLILLLLSPSLRAEQGIFPVPAPAHARLIAQDDMAEAERFYPMSALRRISNQARAELRLEVDGHLARQTYQLASGHLAQPAFAQVRKALQTDADLLFWCEGRDCGASTLWANAVFDRADLSAPDDQQLFGLWRVKAQPETVLAVYAVNRANRRSYLHVEQLHSESSMAELLPTAATWLRQLREDGELQLPASAQAPVEPWLALVVRTLRLDSTLRVALQGEQAEAWQAALVAAGIRTQRLSVAAVTEAGAGLRLQRQ